MPDGVLAKQWRVPLAVLFPAIEGEFYQRGICLLVRGRCPSISGQKRDPSRCRTATRPRAALLHWAAGLQYFADILRIQRRRRRDSGPESTSRRRATIRNWSNGALRKVAFRRI